jgi:hypothetical protein
MSGFPSGPLLHPVYQLATHAGTADPGCQLAQKDDQ